MDILRCMDIFLITDILDLAYVQNYMRCLSQNKSDTKLFRVYLFTIFTIKRPRALTSLAPLGLLIVKTVTNILQTITCTANNYAQGQSSNCSCSKVKVNISNIVF